MSHIFFKQAISYTELLSSSLNFPKLVLSKIMCYHNKIVRMEEIWKDVKGYEEFYQISNKGRVYSIRRNIIMKPQLVVGYHCVLLSVHGIEKTKQIHNMVADAFIPNPNNYPYVIHKDKNRLNNYVDNLEWCTVSDKCKRATSSGRKPVMCIESGMKFNSIMEAERFMNPSLTKTELFKKRHIGMCCNGEKNTAYNLHWKFI